jgi:hypothetical protein
VALQRRDTGLVLPDGGRTAAAPPIELDEEPVPFLARRIEGQQTPGQLHGLVHRALLGPRSGGSPEPIARQPRQPGALVGQPLIEGILAEAQPLEKLARAGLRSRAAELRGVMIRGRCEVLEDETSVRAAFEARAGAQASASPVQPGALASAPKRVVLKIVPEKVVSWDHRKLGGRY